MVGILGWGPAVGKFIKVNDAWLKVVGVLGEAIQSGSQSRGGRREDLNNIVYVPLQHVRIQLLGHEQLSQR